MAIIRTPEHVACGEFPAHDGFIGGKQTSRAPRVDRTQKEDTSAKLFRDLLRYKVPNNYGFPKAWPGPVKSPSHNVYEVDYQKLPLPLPIYSYLRESRVNSLKLEVVQLTGEVPDLAPARRDSEIEGLKMAFKCHINTAVFMIRVLLTVDLAARMLEKGHYAMIHDGNGAHLPFMCKDVLISAHTQNDVSKRSLLLQDVTKESMLVAASKSCRCNCLTIELMTRGLSLYQGVGRFYLNNMERMLERVDREAPEAELEPYDFEFTGPKPRAFKPPKLSALTKKIEAQTEKVDKLYGVLEAAQIDFNLAFGVLEDLLKEQHAALA